MTFRTRLEMCQAAARGQHTGTELAIWVRFLTEEIASLHEGLDRLNEIDAGVLKTASDTTPTCESTDESERN